MSSTPKHQRWRCIAIVPAYNEAATIADVVQDITEHLPLVDVVVVDDGSTDGTADYVPEPAYVLRLPVNLGIGGAMQTGYRFAYEQGYDLALQIDGDGQHPAAEALRLIDAVMEGADLAIGSRFLEPGEYEQQQSRMTGIRILRAMIRLLSGMDLADPTSGYRAVGRDLMRAFAHWYPDDYPEPEVAMLAKRAGYRVEERPVQMRQRQGGVTSISLRRGLFYVLKVSVAMLLNLIRDPWRGVKKGSQS